MNQEDILYAFGVVTLIAFLIFLWFPLNLCWQAKLSGHPVPLLHIIFMKFRGVDRYEVVNSYISLATNNRKVDLYTLEAHYLAAGATNPVVQIMLEDPDLSFDQAALKHLQEIGPKS